MTLLSTRQQFIKMSGRYDLATTSVDDFDTDDGANWFINAGMRMLDRMDRTIKSTSRFFEGVAINAWYLKFQNCRVIEEVWINDTSARTQLTKVLIRDLRDYYDGLVSSADSGTPLYYAPALLRAEEVTDQDSLGTFFNYVLDPSTDDHTYNGIVFLPKTSSAIVVEIIGQFYNTEMASNDDENFWTVNHEDLLVMAALYKLEIFYRNTSGAKDWMSAIRFDMKEIGSDFVEEEIVDLSEMRG